MKSVLIVGYGIVGKNLFDELKTLKPDIYDKFQTENNTKKDKKYDFAFICVDTPYIEKEYPEKDILCDLSQIKMALQENDADIYVIKSAILPGTIDILKKQFNKHIIVSPEYYGATQHSSPKEVSFNFTILGGELEDCCKVQQLLQEVYNGYHRFAIVDALYAETVKYMENSWIKYKVSFCLEFNKLCKELGISYEILRELWLLDERVSRSHTYVYKEHPYLDSHCMNKDPRAIAEMFDMELLKYINKFNDEEKKKFK